MDYEKQFLSDVEDFLEKSGMTPSAFGADAVNDPNFVTDLREGRSCSLRTVSRVRSFIDKNLPPPTKKRKRNAGGT